MYRVTLSKKAQSDLEKLLKSEPQAYKKAMALIGELVLHPRSGRGKPSMKGHDLSGHYARKITGKHRLVCTIADSVLTVEVVSAKDHYGDK